MADFHKLWYNEYLLDLGRNSPGHSRLRSENRLQKDDVVLVKSLLKPRSFWILGTIVELIQCNDDVVRSARVRRGDGLEEVHSFKHLYPLELSFTPNNITQPEVTDYNQPGMIQLLVGTRSHRVYLPLQKTLSGCAQYAMLLN